MTTQVKRSEATRELLVTEAARLFAAHGYEGTSLEMVSRAARVNKAMVSYHFGGKDGLYAAVLISAIRRVAARLDPARDPAMSPPERMRRLIACMADAFAEAPEFPFIVLREEMSGGHRLTPDIVKEFIGFFELDREILLAGIARGDFREVDPHEFHLSLVGGLIFFLASQPFRDTHAGSPRMPGAPRHAAYVRHMTEVFMRGITRS